MRTCGKLTGLVAVIMVVFSAAGLGAPGATLGGSYWYAVDNVTEIGDGAQILIWATVPPAWHGQSVTLGAIVPKPMALIDDPETGNRIIEWRLDPTPFSREPGIEPRNFLFHYDFEVTAFPLHVGDTEGVAADYDRQGDLYRRYTRRENWLQTDGDIKDMAREITAAVETPVARAHALFDWIIDNLEFVPGGSGERDARSILAARAGDCEQFSLLFTAMSRALGIPARTVTTVWPNETLHVFAEVMLPGGKWLPLDLSVGQLMRPDGGGMAPDLAKKYIQVLGLPCCDPGYMFGNLYDKRAVVALDNNISFNSPTLGTKLIFQRMRPGGDDATPEAVRCQGLNKDFVKGGFFVMGEQPQSAADALMLVHLRLADRFFAAGQFDMVEAGCRASLEAKPDAVNAWMDLGRVYMYQLDYYRAEAAFKRALKGDSGHSGEQMDTQIWTHNYLGNCYDLLGHRDLALKEYGAVIALGSNIRGAVDYALKYQAEPFHKYPAKNGAR